MAFLDLDHYDAKRRYHINITFMRRAKDRLMGHGCLPSHAFDLAQHHALGFNAPTVYAYVFLCVVLPTISIRIVAGVRCVSSRVGPRPVHK